MTSKNPSNAIPDAVPQGPDYLDHLIEDAQATRPGFAEMWEPEAFMLRLSEERARLGLSQADVAARLGIGRTAVARMENAPRGVAFSRFLDYARVLGVELSMKPSTQKPKKPAQGPGRRVSPGGPGRAAVA